jgi:GT2 family glycosyltransferase
MVYIILVNWNGWRETLECLESIFRLDEPDYRIIVCDNASQDASLEKIQLWAQGKLAAEVADPRYEFLVTPPVPKPIPCSGWRPGESASGPGAVRLVLIPATENLGFAAGCNLGMRFALACGDAEFLWLLNNDTVVQPQALTHLVAKMRRNTRIGMCGSTLRYYAEPGTIQCYAGFGFNEWTARVVPLSCRAKKGQGWPEESDIEAGLKYVSGASIFLRQEFVETVGLMNEQYFLYFEEIDWATRARGLYSLGYCRESTIFHKEGSKIGSNRSSKSRSLFSERYLSINRVLFTRTYFPSRTPVVLAWVTLVSLQRMLTGHYSSGKTMLVSSWKGLFRRPQSPARRGLA